MANYRISDTSLNAIAAAIREKTGTEASLSLPQGFVSAIQSIDTSGETNALWWDTEEPSDDKTHIWIEFEENPPADRLTVGLRFLSSVAQNTTIDWGDDTVSTQQGATSMNTINYTYNSYGNYEITIQVNEGTISFGDSNISNMFGTITDISGGVNSCIRRIYFGNGIKNSGGLGQYALQGLTNLSRLTLPTNVISYGSNCFYNCIHLTTLTVPAQISLINSNCFNNLCWIKEYHFLPEYPPTISSNTFNNIPYDCIIYVPRSNNQSILTAYQSETNWSLYADHIQEEPE